MKKWLLIIPIVLALLYGFLTSTKLGVHLIIDGIADIGDEPYSFVADESGLQRTEQAVVVAELPMPDQIDQPSGLVHDPRSDRLYMTTDQAELFVLSTDFQILAKHMLSGQTLLKRQGSVEAVALGGEDQTVAVTVGQHDPLGWIVPGDLNEKISRSAADLSWLTAESLPFGEMAGLTRSEGSGRYFAVEEDSPTILELDPSSGEVTAWVPELSPSQGESLERLSFAGVAARDSRLWIVSQSHSILLEVDEETREVRRVVELPERGEYSDLAWVGDELVLTLDHNLFDERPPFLRVRVEESEPVEQVLEGEVSA
ncbi:MAG: SdiA-regulated domain-containing protein [Acidobacteriota bacterium]